MDFMFEKKNNIYNLKNFQEFAAKRKTTVKMHLEALKVSSARKR